MISVLKRLLLALTLGLVVALVTTIAPATAAQSQTANSSVSQVQQTTSLKKCHHVKGHWKHVKGHWKHVNGHWVHVRGHWQHRKGHHRKWIPAHRKWVPAHRTWVRPHRTWVKAHMVCTPPCHYNCFAPGNQAQSVSKQGVSKGDFALRSATTQAVPAGPDLSGLFAGLLGVTLLGAGAASVIVNRRRLRGSGH